MACQRPCSERRAVWLSAAILFIAASNAYLVSAGVRAPKFEYPGLTGALPTSCDAGANETANGAPSLDFALGDKVVVKQVKDDQPEQVHSVLATYNSFYVSWMTGSASYTFCGDGSKDGNATADCFYNQPKAQKTNSVVRYGTKESSLKFTSQGAAGYPTQAQYEQIYGVPGTGENYTSPIVHTVKISGLKPETKYYFQVGDGADTWSQTYTWKTFAPPGTAPAQPQRIGVTADMGTTHATAEVIQGIVANKPDIVFLAGDHSYADNHGNDQRYWDAWFRLLQPITSQVPWQPAFGNHEEETQWNDCVVEALASLSDGFPPFTNATAVAAKGGCGTADEIRANCPATNSSCPCAIASDSGEKGYLPPEFVYNYCNNKAAFVSATTRWPTPWQESGSTSPHFYSFEFGLVHGIALSSYQPYCGGSLPCFKYMPFTNRTAGGNSPQYEWLAKDLAKVDRSKTPWVIVFFHNPWFTTFGGFKTDDCPRQALEPLLKQYNVDFVFNGHIHAYERSNPVYNFQAPIDNSGCDPVHIVVGDAGNDETLTCGLVDRSVMNGKLDCTGQSVAKNSSEGYYFTCHSPTFQDDPFKCQKGDERVNTTVIPASFYGCQEDGYCPNKQPNYSAYRSAEYGSGLLEIISEMEAKWTWKGFFKQEGDSSNHPEKDVVTFNRCTDKCARK